MLRVQLIQHEIADQESRQEVEQKQLRRKNHELLVHFDSQVTRRLVVKVLVFHSAIPVAFEWHQFKLMLGLGLELAHIALGLVRHLVFHLAASDQRVVDPHQHILGIQFAKFHLEHLVLEHVHVALQVVARHLARNLGQAAFDRYRICHGENSKGKQDNQ